MPDTQNALPEVPRHRHTLFPDRVAAGVALADRLRMYRARSGTIVLGLPNGGTVTAAAVARALGIPLDIIIAHMLRVPGRLGRAMGAIAEDGDPHVDLGVVWHDGIAGAQIDAEVARQRKVLAGRQRRLRGGRRLELHPETTVILVDDGASNGLTAMAAIRALRTRGVHHLVLAVPVAPPATIDRLNDMVDELVVLETPLAFRAVGGFYEDFRPVPDTEVRELLAANHASHPGRAEA